MKIALIHGIIRRRLLLNYWADPAVARKMLPPNFSPKLVDGQAIVGLCLIRLEDIRPKLLPALIGISSENAAHRISVEWKDKKGLLQEGVFVLRRDTDSTLNRLAGGRLFPGVHGAARFEVTDSEQLTAMTILSKDFDTPMVELEARETDKLPTSSIFSSLAESSAFFENGCIGYSPRHDGCGWDGVELQIGEWKVTPLHIDRLRSAFYDDSSRFPSGSIAFDHGLVMRDIEHEWHPLPQMETMA